MEPKLRWGLDFYLTAFFDLDTERSHGTGWQRIPWSSIHRYALFYELGEDQTDCLILFIQRMDLAHIDRLEEKRKADEEARNRK